MNTDFPQFPKYTMPGNSVTWEKDGITIKATIVRDEEVDPRDIELPHSDEDIKRWLNDEWFFCGVVLSVSYKGLELNNHAVSLWGIDCNYGEDNRYLAQVAQELEGDALVEAIKAIDNIRTLINNYPLGNYNS